MKKVIVLFAALALVVGISGTANALVLASDISEIYAVGGQDVVIPGDPDYTTYGSLTDPFGGTIGFDHTVQKLTTPGTWATWSHGYTGPVLYSQYGVTSIRMDFGRSIYGFGFYAEPQAFQVFDVTMGLSGGVTQTRSVDGEGGAAFFGFYDDAVDWVQISSADPSGFAFGEMVMAESYRAVPEPTTLLLFGMGTLGLGVIRKFRK